MDLYIVKNEYVYDKSIKGSYVPTLHRMPVIKETEKTYLVKSCPGSGHSSRISKDARGYSHTPANAWQKYIERTTSMLVQIHADLDKNESFLRFAEVEHDALTREEVKA